MAMIPHTIVTLYESEAGDLWIAADDEDVAYDVTERAGQDTEFVDDVGRVFVQAGSFEGDAVALLDGDMEDWAAKTCPKAEITASLGETNGNRIIAIYDGANGGVEVMRLASGQPIAATNGRRYIGYLGED